MANSRTKSARQISREVQKNHRRGGHLIAIQNGKKIKLPNGKKGGYAVGAMHGPEGGIKGVVGTEKSPIEFQGQEAVITAPALSDKTLHDFEGKKMTKRQILSAINVDAGGVSFASGGRVGKKMKVRYCNKRYKYGGKMMSGKDIISDCGCQHKMEKGGVTTNNKLLSDLSHVQLAESYQHYHGHPEELMKYVQEQATGLDGRRKHVNTDYIAFNAVSKMIGSKDLVLRCVAAMPQMDKDKVIKAWKGKALDPELRRALRKKTMGTGGTIEEQVKYVKEEYDFDGTPIVQIHLLLLKQSTGFGLYREGSSPAVLYTYTFDIKNAARIGKQSGIEITNENILDYIFDPLLSSGFDNKNNDIKELGQFKSVELGFTYLVDYIKQKYGYDLVEYSPEGETMEYINKQIEDRKTIVVPDLSHEVGNSRYYQHYKRGGHVVKPYPDFSNELPPVINEKGGELGKEEIEKVRPSQKSIREIELRMVDRKDMPEITFQSSQTIYDYLWSIWNRDLLNIQESFYVLYLNRAQKLIGYQELSKGGITGTIADPTLIVATASKALAKSVVLAHNHPSGSLKPSRADEQMTEQIQNALKYIDCKLLDHIILTPEKGSYYSFIDEGIISYARGGMFAKGGPVISFEEFKKKYPKIYGYKNAKNKQEWQLSIPIETGYLTYYALEETKEDAYAHIYSQYKHDHKSYAKGGEVNKKELYFVWRRNKEGGQKIGNAQRVVPVTQELFKKEVLPRTRKGYYSGKTISEQYQNMLKKHPDSYISYVNVNGKEKVHRVSDLETILETIKINEKKGWVKQVASLTSKEAKEFRMIADSEMDEGGKTVGEMTPEQFLSNLQKLRKFVPSFQVEALVEIYRGEESEYALEIMQRLLHTFETMPGTYDTEDQKTNDKVIYLHYFYGGMDWYIVEKDKGQSRAEEKKAGLQFGAQYQAFGYANLDDSPQGGEWGYISIVELMQTNKVEIDFNWTPITFGNLTGAGRYEETDVSTGPSEDQRWLKILQKYPDKSVIASLSKKKQAEYDENEDDNNHTENIVLLAKATENGELIEAAELILSEQEKLGHFPPDYRELRNRLSDIIKVEKEGSQSKISQIAAANPGKIIIASVASSAPATKQQASTTAKQQGAINEQIRKLVKEKGANRDKYSAQEIALIKLYEGAGAEKATTNDVRILDQFFTPMDIVAKMWGMAIKHGFTFKETAVLEPSVGSGRFLQYIPLPSKDVIVSVDAYDVDETCVNICKVLYPFFSIKHESFESLFFRGRTHIGLAGVTKLYDLVIGNPPYREYVSPYAPLGEKAQTGAFTFEMYFITRGIDVLKPGGLLCYIIPNTFLSNDNKYNEFKEKLAKKCDLIDAYRLANGVFGNTAVGTDIILLRKNK